jgi:hypothetical protein
MNITYSKTSDYLLPDLELPKEANFTLSRFGRARKNYLKNYKNGLYSSLMLSGKIFTHLAEIDAHAQEMFELITRQLAEKENITEQLKAENQMGWVCAMNNIRHRAEDFVLKELIFI